MHDSQGHDHAGSCYCRHDAPARPWSAYAEVAVLAILAGFLVFATATGRVQLFVAPAYKWLPLAAAIVLSLMAWARLRSVLGGDEGCQCDDHDQPSLTRALFSAALLAAMAAALVVDPRQFSTEAVRKRQLASDARDRRLQAAVAWVMGRTSAKPADAAPTGSLPSEPTLLQLTQAAESGQAEAWAGRFVTVIGQCDATLDPSGKRFELYRMLVTCCVADAQSLSLEVVNPGGATNPSRQWIRVSGILRIENGDGSGRLVIHATSVTPIPVPAAPYL